MENNPTYYLVEVAREIIKSTEDVDTLKQVAMDLADNLELAAKAYDLLKLKDTMKNSLDEELRKFSLN